MAYQNYHYRIISSENITSGAASAQSGSAPFGTKAVRIATSASVNVAINGNPTATSASTLIQSADSQVFTVAPASTVGGTDGDKVASIGTATVNVTWLGA